MEALVGVECALTDPGNVLPVMPLVLIHYITMDLLGLHQKEYECHVACEVVQHVDDDDYPGGEEEGPDVAKEFNFVC